MPKIYHYTKSTTALFHILSSMQLRSNSLASMNDPRENQLWSFGGVNTIYEKLYPETYTDATRFKHMHIFGEEIKKTVQVICFVHNEDRLGYANEMMWTHYAENHQGICLEIDEDLFLEENQAQLSHYHFDKIQYGNDRKIMLHGDAICSKTELIQIIVENQYQDLFLKKSEVWKGENEKRLLIINPNQIYLSIKKALTGVYLGLETESLLCHVIEKQINLNQTAIYYTYYRNNRIEPFTPDPGDYRPFVSKDYIKEIRNLSQLS